MSKTDRNGMGLTKWRVLTLLLGAALAACGAAWTARSLSVKEAQLHVGQGPHLYVRGRNYPGPDVVVPRASEMHDADASDASTRSSPSQAG